MRFQRNHAPNRLFSLHVGTFAADPFVEKMCGSRFLAWLARTTDEAADFMVSLLKGIGYAVSTLSVILLGIVSWKNASEQPLIFACLLAGMASSILGMLLRWLSHRMDQKEKEAAERGEMDLRAEPSPRI
jgi:hypothetical protein